LEIALSGEQKTTKMIQTPHDKFANESLAPNHWPMTAFGRLVPGDDSKPGRPIWVMIKRWTEAGKVR
jgi:hypothetical protein